MIFWDHLLIASIVMFLIGFGVWLKLYGEYEVVLTLLMLFAIVVATTSFFIPRTTYTEIEHTNEYSLWSCDAPYGRYWVDIEGTISFLGGSVDSKLVESYTLKYLVGDELKTIILSSTAENVHLHLTAELSMTLEIVEYIHDYQIGPSKVIEEPTYHIYVPDPKLMEVTA